MCYFRPSLSELSRLFWQLSLVHPFGAWHISLVNLLLRVSAGESHLMVYYAPMGGARRQSMSILHVEPTRPAYIPISVSFCLVRLERGIHPCSCWWYKRHWRAIDKWGDASIPSRIWCANAPPPRPPPRLPVQPLPRPPRWQPPLPCPGLNMPWAAPAKGCCPMFWIGGI
jgi:hypothetical protein